MERGKIFEKVRFYAETAYDAGGMDGEKMIFQIRSDVTFNLFAMRAITSVVQLRRSQLGKCKIKRLIYICCRFFMPSVPANWF